MEFEPGRVELMDTFGLGIGRISDEQAHQLAQLHLAIALDRDHAHGLTELAHHAALLLSAVVAVFLRRDRRWTMVAESTSDRPRFPIAAAAAFSQLHAPECRVEDGSDWTLLPSCVHGAPPVVLAIQGDWTSSLQPLVLLGRNVSLALLASTTTARARLGLATHRLARLLAREGGLSVIAQIIITHMARAVDARIAALAVPDKTKRELSIVATHGYPLTLVEHLHIDAGAGVLGTVFRTGRTMHAKSADVFPNRRHRRPRYRTDSFVAVPILGGREVVAVVCATDRRNDDVFGHQEISTLRALAAPASLALSRERARLEAAEHAQAAAIDPVSGVFNRRYFHIRLEEELQRARRHEIPLALLLIDIDDFKSVNDSFGHLVGDAVLRDVAEILRRSIRVFDICARFGGEEFTIIMPGSAAENAVKIAERIRQRIEKYRSWDPALAALQVTVSIGLAISAVGTPGIELIARADQALYAAKRAGKNGVRVIGSEEPPRLGSDVGEAERG